MRPTIVAAILTSALTVTACTSGAPAPRPEPDIGPIPTITHPSQVQRPIRAVTPTADDIRGIRKAREVLINKCLKDKGKEPVQFIHGTGDGTTGRDGEYSELWGTFSLDDDRNSSQESVRGAAAEAPEFNECAWDVRQTQMPIQREWFEFAHVYVLPDGGPPAPVDDSRVKAAQDQWRACLTNRGYDVGNTAPLAVYDILPNKPGTRGPDPKAQQTLSKADLDCKLETNLVGKTAAVQYAYDQRWIEDHRAELLEFRRKIDTFLRENR